MRCETFLERIDALDSGEEPNFFLQLHAASCPECRAEVERMERAIAAYRSVDGPEPGLVAGAAGRLDVVEDRVMTAVRLLPRPKRELHARDWIVSGVVLALSLALIPYDRNFSLIDQAFGASYSLPFYLVLGTVLTVYATVFIGTHVEELAPFVKRWARAAR